MPSMQRLALRTLIVALLLPSFAAGVVSAQVDDRGKKCDTESAHTCSGRVIYCRHIYKTCTSPCNGITCCYQEVVSCSFDTGYTSSREFCGSANCPG